MGCPLAGIATDKWAHGCRFRVVMPLLLSTACLLFLYAEGGWFLLTADPIHGIIADQTSSVSRKHNSSGTTRSDWSYYMFDVVLLSGLGIGISGPDSIFAGPAAQDIGKQSAGILGPATVVGMVDGFGSLGAVLQGHVTAVVVYAFGWAGVFRLGGTLLVASSLLCINPSRLEVARLFRSRKEPNGNPKIAA